VEVTPAARRAGISSDSIRRACDDGRIEAVRTASGQRLIDPDSLERFIAERRERRGR